jgi:hypothetical protein
MNQQRRRRQTISGIVKRLLIVCGGRNDVGNEFAQSFQHQTLNHQCSGIRALCRLDVRKMQRAQSAPVPQNALSFGNRRMSIGAPDAAIRSDYGIS